jgi:hypothetical protein
MKQILFGLKEDWAVPIGQNLDAARFRANFREFNDRQLAFRNFDCVVPLRLTDYWPLRNRGGRGNYLIPGHEIVALSTDKCRMNAYLQQNGFGEFVPEIYGDKVTYPFIYKKHKDEWGLHSRIVRTPEEMAGLEPPAPGEVRFKQEYVVGHIEYVTHMLAVDGEPRYTLTFEHGFDSDHFIKGRWAHYISHVEVETPIMDVLGGILKSLHYTGTCCFNYKFANGVPKIFEMNPRYGATLTERINDYLEIYMDALESECVT